MTVRADRLIADIDRAITSALRTGRVLLGGERTLAMVRLGRVKLVILSSNCPEGLRRSLEEYAKMASIPVYNHPSTSLDLGMVCGKPFPVSAIGVREPGDSNILDVMGVGYVE